MWWWWELSGGGGVGRRQWRIDISSTLTAAARIGSSHLPRLPRCRLVAVKGRLLHEQGRSVWAAVEAMVESVHRF